MKTKKRIVNVSLSLIFTLFVPVMSLSQSESTTAKASDTQWNMYSREFALDFSNLNRDLSLGSIGSNLIFKKRIGVKKSPSLDSQKAFRLQLGGYAAYPIGQASLDTLAALQNARYYNWKNISLRLLLGIEWQKQINRIQLYYGLDAGIRYSESVLASSIQTGSNPGQVTKYTQTDRSDLSIPVYAFLGVKYFIHPRISIALESALNTGLSWSSFMNTEVDNINNRTITTLDASRREINFGTEYVRYINVGFHF